MKYHTFYTNPYGMSHHYKVFDDLAPVLELVRQDRDETSEVRDLVVVYGTLLEFEPALVVQSYKLKGGLV